MHKQKSRRKLRQLESQLTDAHDALARADLHARRERGREREQRGNAVRVCAVKSLQSCQCGVGIPVGARASLQLGSALS